jgi:hypothetical protein
VDHVNELINTTAAQRQTQAPSIVMSACAHLPVWADGIAATAEVRDRQAFTGTVSTKGDMGLFPTYFPGTRAWRPPTS